MRRHPNQPVSRSPHSGFPTPLEVARPLLARLRRDIGSRSPIFVAIDGRSGSGKSTLAAVVADALAAGGTTEPKVTVIQGDLFYGGSSAQTWDSWSVAERVDRVFDWRRQHQVLTDLRSQGESWWRPFDWDAGHWDADNVALRHDPIHSVVAPVVVLEGAYSARPELHDVLDLLVLLEVPATVRHRQLAGREADHYRRDWEARWSEAEDHYFGSVMPSHRFDLALGVADDGSVT